MTCLQAGGVPGVIAVQGGAALLYIGTDNIVSLAISPESAGQRFTFSKLPRGNGDPLSYFLHPGASIAFSATSARLEMTSGTRLEYCLRIHGRLGS